MKERFLPLLLSAALCFLSGPQTFAQCTPDSYEEDDACIPSKAVIQGGDTQSHNFCDDAADWISFNACTGRSYTIETSNLGTLADTVLELYDTNCASLLTSDNDGGTGLASLIASWVAPADGTYHIKVLQFDGSFGDDREYDVALTGDTTACSTWARTYGGADEDRAMSIQQTTDGGYVLAGWTYSFGAGGFDFWVLKLDGSGIVEWEKTYGGASTDQAYSIQQTSDGGYVVAGFSQSYGAGGSDFWILKLDASGNVSWQKTYGGGSIDRAYSIQQTMDGGFVIAGTTWSFGAGWWDFWVLKLDASGNVTWQKTYGGASQDYAYSIQQTTDGSFIVAGDTQSFGAGDRDVWVLKLDASGNVTWQKTYGGASQDYAYSIQQTTDGGYVVAGWTASFGPGGYDFWILKLDGSGIVEWGKTYVGALVDYAYSIQQTTDGGFVGAGRTVFSGGSNDCWILKLDALGNIEWQKTYGGNGWDGVDSIHIAVDGGFIVSGATQSFGAGLADVWVLKLDAAGEIGVSCPIITDTFATGNDTSIVATASTGIETISTIVSTDTFAAAADSAAIITGQCSLGVPCVGVQAQVDAVAPSTTVCQGVAQTFSGMGAGEGPLVYEWDFSYDGVTFNVEDTGNPVSYAQPAAGSYTVRVRVTDSCAAGAQTAEADVPVTVNALPTPTITPDGPTTFCDGSSITLDAGGGYMSYLWSPGGGTTQTINVTAGGSYTVTVTDGNGCSGTSPPEVVAVDCPVWARTYGGADSESAGSVQQTTDGGFVAAGRTDSFGAGGDDVWVLKLDSLGTVEWQKTYGGADSDYANSIRQTSDGGFVVAGYTNSFGAGNDDFWVLKLDASGNVQWQKTYGGTGGESAHSIQQTSDGGYVVAGETTSFGAGSYDFWVLKLDASGNVEWQKSLGGANPDVPYSVEQTTDGGYVVTGYTESFGAGSRDFWVLKLDASGNVEWQKTYGGALLDYALSIQQTSDGDFVVAGYTNSFGAGSNDFWVLKLDASGNVSWQKTYGGTFSDVAWPIQSTTDGGFVVAGWTWSFGAGGFDSWVLKLDASGSVQWQNAYGITGDDYAYSIEEAADGGYIVGGYTSSFGAGNNDAWVLKLDLNGNVDASCVFITDTAATITDTTATITFTTVTGVVSAATITDTAVTGVDSTATVQEQCYGCAADAFEPDDDCVASEAVIHGAETQTHNFCDNTDDWISFNACTGRSYTIETSNLGLNTDTVLELYDTDCATLLLSDDNGGAGLASLINWTAPADGTYHIKVMQFGGVFWNNCEYDVTLTGDTSPCWTWARTYGGPSIEYGSSVQQTSDGGFVVAGRTDSFGAGNDDFWVLKLDDLGNVQWQKTYGGSLDDIANSVQQTADGGFVVGGETQSFGGDRQFWVLKLDASGAVEWQYDYGGGYDDVAYSIQQTADGGYVVAGRTDSYGVDTPTYSNLWVLKLDAYQAYQIDASGKIEWQKTYGEASSDGAFSIQQTTDGGYIVAGYTDSFGGWILKLDASGTVEWQKTYGGFVWEEAYSIQQTADGGYVVAGYLFVDSVPDPGCYCDCFLCPDTEFWVLKLDASGNVQWQKSYGGALRDYAQSIRQTTDRGFVVAGYTQSFVTGNYDSWVLKLDASGSIQWQKTYGGASSDWASSIQQTTDGGFVVAGGTESFGAGSMDLWVLKLDANGEIDTSCTFISDTSEPGRNIGNGVENTSATGLNSSTEIYDTFATGVDSTADISVQCSSCPALSVGASVDSDLVCLGASQTYTAAPASGVSPFTYEWDFSYDGVAFNTEGTGNPVTYTQPATGPYTVRVRVTDSCSLGPTVAFADVPVTVNPLFLDVSFDAAFDPVATLAQDCGDGDLVIEPGERWSVTVQLVNNAPTCTANNVRADLTVNAGSAAAAAVCSNPGLYGTMPSGATAQFTYEFVVDPAAVCVNDITFDVTGIASDEGPYPDEIPAFTIPQPGQTETGMQVTNPLTAQNETISSDFAPAFSLAAPATVALLSYTFTGTTDLVNCVEVALIDPFATTTVVKPLGAADANPYDVTGLYTGPGTYQLRLMEDSKGCGGGGDAQIASGTLDVGGCNFITGCPCPPSEPSPPASFDPLLIPTTAADQILVEDVANESGYVVYEEAIGTWYGTPSQGCLAAWTDLGSTVQLGYAMALGNRWVVVSSANAAGESSCGMDSVGTERNAQPGWPAVGPCP